MNDFGFVSVGNAADNAVAEPQESTTQENQVADTGSTTAETGAEGITASVEPVQTDNDNAGQPAAAATSEPVKETVYVDPFAELGDTERSIFDSIKNKDYKSLRDVLDAITTDYDQVGDIDLIKRQLKESKPRWTDEMIDAELTRKYGLGYDEAELPPNEAMLFKMALIDDADAARAHFKAKQSEVKFPELQQTQVEAKPENQMTPEQAADFQRYWTGHIENSVKDLTDEVYKIEVGRDGNKEIFDFPITYAPEDKQSLKTLVSDLDINKDFQSKYVKGTEIDLKSFMRDRFRVENFDKLINAAFAQGHAQGKLGQIKGDKNLVTGSTNQGASTHDMVEARTNAALNFLNNGRKR